MKQQINILLPLALLIGHQEEHQSYSFLILFFPYSLFLGRALD